MSYTCKYCGREFEKRHQLIGHVTWCKEKPGYDEIKKKQQLENARSKISHYNNGGKYTKDTTEYYCQFCGKICIGKNSLAQHERFCKNNPNRAESPFVKYNKEKDHVWNKGLAKETDERLAKAAETLSKGYKSGRIKPSNIGIALSEEQKQKISKSRKKYLEEHPDQVPYLLNHSSEISTPEQYFITLFENENIPLSFHKQISVYQLDFYNDDKMFYLEIDGEQHYQEKSIERDKIRDEYLRSLGWRGMRIRWSTWQKLDRNEKELIIKSIREKLK
jgi:very-short-patch-repair endonuclease